MAYTKYSLTPANNNAAPPDGAPEGMLPSAVNDTMRDMMAQIRDCGDGIRGGTYTMTAPVITGGSINGTTTITTSGAISYTGTLTGGTGVVNLGSGQFYKDASGNVGIGTSSPFGTAANRVVASINGTSSSILSLGSGGTERIGLYSDTNQGQLYTTSTLPMVFSTNSVERMRIDSSGNVGIGTASPASKLDVVGSLRLTNTSNAANYGLLSDLGGLYVQSLNSNPMYFATGGSERMRIDSSGNLLVGTTSATARFVVTAATNSSYAGAIRSDIAGDVAQAPLIVIKYDNNSTTSQVFQRFAINSGGTANGQINANGASAVAFGSWSDKRLKENIVDLPSQLENITALRPVEFDYKAGGHQIGFIAQEMQEVYPDVVGEDENGMLTITGWSKTEARLVKAFQEQQVMIEELKAKVAALEAA